MHLLPTAYRKVVSFHQPVRHSFHLVFLHLRGCRTCYRHLHESVRRTPALRLGVETGSAAVLCMTERWDTRRSRGWCAIWWWAKAGCHRVRVSAAHVTIRPTDRVWAAAVDHRIAASDAIRCSTSGGTGTTRIVTAAIRRDVISAFPTSRRGTTTSRKKTVDGCLTPGAPNSCQMMTRHCYQRQNHASKLSPMLATSKNVLTWLWPVLRSLTQKLYVHLSRWH